MSDISKLNSVLFDQLEKLDRTNCNIDNLSLIPRSLLVRYNKLQVNDYDADTRPTIKLIAKINHVSSEITKGTRS